MAVVMPLEFVAKRRWDRRHKLLRSLGLRYPNDGELRKLAELANVDADNCSIFGEQIRSLILDAHLSNSSLRGLSKPKIRNFLTNVASQAQQLSDSLRAIDVGARGSAEHAGFLLEMELWKTQSILLPEYVAILGGLSDAAKRGASSIKSKRGQRNLAFNQFIEGLLMAAWQRRGQWTLYRSGEKTWKGTMLEALKILQQYLPPQFFPGGVLGRSADYARLKLKQHITKNQGSRR